MRLTVEKMVALSGQNADEIEEFSQTRAQLTEVQSLGKCVQLRCLDLSGNRFQVRRHLEGVFEAPKLERLELLGAPVCKSPQYRLWVIAHAPASLKHLDGNALTFKRAVGDWEIELASKQFPTARATMNERRRAARAAEDKGSSSSAFQASDIFSMGTETAGSTARKANKDGNPEGFASFLDQFGGDGSPTLKEDVDDGLMASMFSGSAQKKAPKSRAGTKSIASVFGGDDADIFSFDTQKKPSADVVKSAIEIESAFDTTTPSSKPAKAADLDGLFSSPAIPRSKEAAAGGTTTADDLFSSPVSTRAKRDASKKVADTDALFASFTQKSPALKEPRAEDDVVGAAPAAASSSSSSSSSSPSRAAEAGGLFGDDGTPPRKLPVQQSDLSSGGNSPSTESASRGVGADLFASPATSAPTKVADDATQSADDLFGPVVQERGRAEKKSLFDDDAFDDILSGRSSSKRGPPSSSEVDLVLPIVDAASEVESEEERARKQAALDEERKRKQEQEEERRKKQEEEEAQMQAEMERLKEEQREKEEAERKAVEEEAERVRLEEARKLKEEEERRAAAEQKRREEEERKRIEAEKKEEERRQREEERKRKEEEERKRLEEEERKRKEEEERRRAEEERRRLEEEERKRKEEEARRAEEERIRKEKEEEERRRREEEERKRKEEEERRRREEEERARVERERQRRLEHEQQQTAVVDSKELAASLLFVKHAIFANSSIRTVPAAVEPRSLVLDAISWGAPSQLLKVTVSANDLDVAAVQGDEFVSTEWVNHSELSTSGEADVHPEGYSACDDVAEREGAPEGAPESAEPCTTGEQVGDGTVQTDAEEQSRDKSASDGEEAGEELERGEAGPEEKETPRPLLPMPVEMEPVERPDEEVTVIRGSALSIGELLNGHASFPEHLRNAKVRVFRCMQSELLHPSSAAASCGGQTPTAEAVEYVRLFVDTCVQLSTLADQTTKEDVTYTASSQLQRASRPPPSLNRILVPNKPLYAVMNFDAVNDAELQVALAYAPCAFVGCTSHSRCLFELRDLRGMVRAFVMFKVAPDTVSVYVCDTDEPRDCDVCCSTRTLKHILSGVMPLDEGLRSGAIVCDNIVSLLPFAAAFRFHNVRFMAFREHALRAWASVQVQRELEWKKIQEKQLEEDERELAILMERMQAERAALQERRKALKEEQRRKREEEEEKRRLMEEARPKVEAAQEKSRKDPWAQVNNASLMMSCARIPMVFTADTAFEAFDTTFVCLFDICPEDGDRDGGEAFLLRISLSSADNTPSASVTPLACDTLDEEVVGATLCLRATNTAMLTVLMGQETLQTCIEHGLITIEKGSDDHVAVLTAAIDFARLSQLEDGEQAAESEGTEDQGSSERAATATPSETDTSAAEVREGHVDSDSGKWVDNRLAHAFNFMLDAWRGTSWSGEALITVVDDPLPSASQVCALMAYGARAVLTAFTDVVVTLTPGDVVMNPQNDESEFFCKVSGNKESIVALLTGKSSPMELVAAGDLAVSGDFRKLLSAFALDNLAYEAFARSHGFDLEDAKFGRSVSKRDKAKEAFLLMPHCKAASPSDFTGVANIRLRMDEDEILEHSVSVVPGRRNESGKPQPIQVHGMVSPDSTCEIEMSWLQFVRIVAATLDAGPEILEKRITTDNVTSSMSFFQYFDFKSDRYERFVRTFRDTRDIAQARKVVTKTSLYDVTSILGGLWG